MAVAAIKSEEETANKFLFYLSKNFHKGFEISAFQTINIPLLRGKKCNIRNIYANRFIC